MLSDDGALSGELLCVSRESLLNYSNTCAYTHVHKFMMHFYCILTTTVDVCLAIA